MKIAKNLVTRKKPKTDRQILLEEVKLKLPLLQEKYIKKCRGINKLINNFIFIPDERAAHIGDIRLAYGKLYEFFKNDSVSYALFDISFDKFMKPKFYYYFDQESTELSGFATLKMTDDGWKVSKINDFGNMFED
jgi:hypothetical protein